MHGFNHARLYPSRCACCTNSHTSFRLGLVGRLCHKGCVGDCEVVKRVGLCELVDGMWIQNHRKKLGYGHESDVISVTIRSLIFLRKTTRVLSYVSV